MPKWFRWKRWILLSAIFLLFVIAAGIPIALYSVESNAVLLSSAILGALPLALFEAWDRLKSPHCMVKGVEVVKYPDTAYDIENESRNKFGNNLKVRVAVANEGNDTAEECTADLVETHTGKRFPTLWNKKGETAPSIDLAPGETQEITVFDINLWNGNFQHYVQNDEDEYVMHGTDYEINNANTLQFELRIKAANMEQVSLPIEFDNTQELSGFDILYEVAQDNPMADVLRKTEKYAITYRMDDSFIMEMPESMDPGELQVFEPFDEDGFYQDEYGKWHFDKVSLPLEIRRE